MSGFMDNEYKFDRIYIMLKIIKKEVKMKIVIFWNKYRKKY